jgi:hypothetical protein
MAINTYRFWMATDANRLLANQNAFIQAAAPAFYQGNVAQLELHIVASSGVGTSPVELPFPAGAEISVAVGDTNTYPTGGSWELSVDEVETAPMPYNATTAQVASALNALSSVSSAGGVSVYKTGDGYTITWNTYGLKPSIGIGPDTLTPSSYQSISLVQTGSADSRQIVFVELRQNPIALGVDWTPLPSPTVTVSEVQAWNGTNKIYRVTISPQPKAGTITIAYGTKTATLAYNASPASITSALSPAQAFATGQYQWDIAIVEDSVLTASGSLVGYNGYSGSINFATAECHQFLAGAERKSTTLEVSMSVDDKRYTLIQTPCNVFADVVSDGVLVPIPLGVALSEQVANARFVRRDVNQNPDSATQDVIWQNLGVETLGSDVAGALNGADSPSAANPFATMSDIPNETEAVWGGISGTLSNQTDLQAELDDKYDASNPDGFITSSALAGYATESWVTSQGYITSASFNDYARLDGATFTGGVNFTWTLGFQDNGHLDASGVDSDGRFRIRFGQGNGGSIAWGDFGFNGTYLVYGNGQNQLETVASQTWVRAGVTFTGKVNMAAPTAGSASLNLGVGTAPTTSVAGDIWIATNINYRDSAGVQKAVANTNTSNTYTAPQIIQTTVGTVNPALRITQNGTGDAFRVEDETPETTPFVINQFGKVGVGTAPDATAAIKVDSNGISFNGLVFNPTGTAAHTGGSDTLDLLVTINGVNYRLGLRPA